ncbi:hypothetical protein [Paraburkholderia domus]|uniref:aromatic-ring hydroxylase C-terminal domain-containing protein n=1 Tax=Paraburkholderia domus TaxID=2793075 RepID=UPI002E29341F|nr:hypothetical protein [Paraburkholderia domus]
MVDSLRPLEALTSRWRERVSYVAGDARDRLGLRAVLVRPDGFVAWASEACPDDEETAEALSLWFGEPEDAGASAWSIATSEGPLFGRKR